MLQFSINTTIAAKDPSGIEISNINGFAVSPKSAFTPVVSSNTRQSLVQIPELSMPLPTTAQAQEGATEHSKKLRFE